MPLLTTTKAKRALIRRKRRSQRADQVLDPTEHIFLRRVMAHPHTARQNDIMVLQRAVGNRAVSQFLAPKPIQVMQMVQRAVMERRAGSFETGDFNLQIQEAITKFLRNNPNHPMLEAAHKNQFDLSIVEDRKALQTRSSTTLFYGEKPINPGETADKLKSTFDPAAGIRPHLVIYINPLMHKTPDDVIYTLNQELKQAEEYYKSIIFPLYQWVLQKQAEVQQKAEAAQHRLPEMSPEQYHNIFKVLAANDGALDTYLLGQRSKDSAERSRLWAQLPEVFRLYNLKALAPALLQWYETNKFTLGLDQDPKTQKILAFLRDMVQSEPGA